MMNAYNSNASNAATAAAADTDTDTDTERSNLETDLQQLRGMFHQERQACYLPCVSIASRDHNHDRDDYNHDAATLTEARMISRLLENDRPPVVEWFYKIVDHFGINREVVAIACNFTDRYTVLHNSNNNNNNKHDSAGFLSKRTYKLVALTALYLAVKLYMGTGAPAYYHHHRDSSFFDVSNLAVWLSDLSHRSFTAQQLLDMERLLLDRLEWRVHPVTPQMFLHYYIYKVLLPTTTTTTTPAGGGAGGAGGLFSVMDQLRFSILHKATFMVEESLLDSYFLAYTASELAMGALCNAVAVTTAAAAAATHFSILDNPLQVLTSATGHSWDYRRIMDCRKRLGHVVADRTADAVAKSTPATRPRGKKALRVQSPVSVVGGASATTASLATTTSTTTPSKLGKRGIAGAVAATPDIVAAVSSAQAQALTPFAIDTATTTTESTSTTTTAASSTKTTTTANTAAGTVEQRTCALCPSY